MREKRIVLWIRRILAAIVFLPAVAWTGFPVDHTTFKSWLFFILVECAFVFYLLLLARNREYIPKKSAITMLVAVVLFLQLISVFASVDGARSFWGTWNRSADSGFLAILHYALFFLVCVGVLRKPEHWKPIIRVSVAAAVVVSVVGLAQLLTTGDRIAGTLVNPIVFAAYIGMNLFLMLFLSKSNLFVIPAFEPEFRKRTKIKTLDAQVKPGGDAKFSSGNFLGSKRSWLVAAVGALFVFVMFQSLSRGPLLALGATTVALFLWSLVKDRGVLRVAATLFLVVAIMGVGLLFLGDNEKSRFTSFEDSSVSNRLHAWKIAVVGIALKPWFGWGQENFSYLFDQNYDPAFLTASNAETWWDRAHNVYLDTAATTGIIGLVFFVSLLAAGFFLSFRIGIFLAAAFAFYAIGGFTFFDAQPTYIMLFLSLAAAHVFSTVQKVDSFLPAPVLASTGAGLNKGFFQNKNPRFFSVGLHSFAALVVVMLCVQAVIFWRSASANYYMNSVGTLPYEQAVESFRRSLDIVQPYRDEVRYELANYVVNAQFMGVIPDIRREDDFAFAKKEIEAAAAQHRRDAKLAWQAARLNNVYYAFKNDPALLDDAEFFEAWGSASSPGRQQIFYEQAQTATLRGDHREAIKKLKEIIVLNRNFPGAWFTLGLGYLNAGDSDKGIEYVEFSQSVGHIFQESDISNWLVVAKAYYEQRNYDRVVDIYRGLLDVAPDNLSLYKMLAVVYAEAGKYEEAIGAALQLRARAPELAAEIEAFIAQVEQAR